MTASGTVGGRSRDEVWAQLTGALGVPADAAPGDRIAARDEPAWQAWLGEQFAAR